jgi:hypothetical protein
MKRSNKQDLFKDDNKGEVTPPLPLEKTNKDINKQPLNQCPDCSSVDVSIQGDDGLCNDCGWNAPKEDFKIKIKEKIEIPKVESGKRKGISLRFNKRIKSPEVKKKEASVIISRERKRVITDTLSSLVLFFHIIATKLGKFVAFITDGKVFTCIFAMIFSFFGCCYLYKGLKEDVEVWQTLLAIIIMVFVLLLANYYADKE